MIPPAFLVIGAMKCATTTLYHDLLQNPSFTCYEKEEGLFLHSDWEQALNRSTRDVSTADSGSGGLYGEICTMYSMLPDVPGIPSRVAKLLGDKVKIVYLVRNPLHRTLSHHQHFFNWTGKGMMGGNINQELALHPQLLHYSCYGMQIESWIAKFGRDAIHVMRFEDYVSDRLVALKGLCDFLGTRDKFGPLRGMGANRGESRRVAGAGVLRLYQTAVFHKLIKPYAPSFLRTVLRAVLLRNAKTTVIAPAPATIDQMLEVLAPDAERFEKLIGAGKPLWDLADTAHQLKMRPS